MLHFAYHAHFPCFPDNLLLATEIGWNDKNTKKKEKKKEKIFSRKGVISVLKCMDK